jgi:hypothetical protein
MNDNVITIQVDLTPVISKIDQLQQEIRKMKMSNSPNEQWLTLSKTCELLHVSKRTLQTYRDNGILAFSQIGPKIYFKSSDIEKFLKKNYVNDWNTNSNVKQISNGR